MKALVYFAAVSILVSPLGSASVRQSASYSTSAESFDAGGALVSSASYRNLGSVGLVGGDSAGSSYAGQSGYPAQIGGLPVPQITIEQPEGAVIADGGSRDFGPVTLGATASLQFTIRNTGSADLYLDGSTIDGPHALEFGISSGPLNASLPPGSSTTMTVSFLPSAFGIRSAALHLSNTSAGSTDPYDIVLTGYGNTIPTFSGHAISTPFETPAALSLGKLLSKAADVDGDALTVTSVNYLTNLGATVTLGAASITYSPAADFTGFDNFHVTLSDPHGATVSGVVTVTVGSPPGAGGQGGNTPQLTMLPGGDVGISFQGIPGRTYQIQRSTNLTDWTPLTTVTAAGNGAVDFTDEDPPEGSAFYRLRRP